MIAHQKKLNFIIDLLDVKGKNPFGIEIVDQKPFTMDKQMMNMFQRFMSNKTTIFPFVQKDKIYWLVCNTNKTILLRDYHEVYSFIKYYCDPTIHTIHYFKRSSHIGLLGKEIFPDGYFLLKSTKKKAKSIWNMLGLWMQLDERRPLIQLQETERSAFSLRSKFLQYLALENWEEAEKILGEIKQGHYISDENCLFLQIQLWTQQRQWDQIWYSKEFDSAVKTKNIPLQIRRSLLTAFYHIVLASSEVEGKFLEAHENFKKNRFRLGQLIHTYLGLEEEIHLRIFLHEAFFKRDRGKLEILLEETDNPTSKELCQYILTQLPTGSKEKAEAIPKGEKEEVACYYLKERQYDKVYDLLKNCSPSPKTVDMLCRLATVTEAQKVCRLAYEKYEGLSHEEQEELMKNPDSKVHLISVKYWMLGIKSEVESLKNETWNHWFQSFLSGELSKDQLDERLENINELNRTFDWSPSIIDDLTDILTSIAVEDLSTSKRNLLDKALPFFISHFLLQNKFPNPKAQGLYEYTIELMKIHSKKNQNNTGLFLRLVEGLLLLDVSLIHDLWKSVKEWFNISPTKMLLPQVLIGLESFEEYGLSHEEIRDFWEQWTASIGDGVRSISARDLEAWREIGYIVGGNEYFLHNLDEIIEGLDSNRQIDIIRNLPSLTVTIFTLREQTAKRAIERLEARNEKINYRICSDEFLTDQSKAYAKNSDVNVIVTTCLTHALYYGISQYVSNKTIVYPRRSGTSGIITALEEYFQKNK